jgi:hypothetical protein
MKRTELLRHLRASGATVLREGRRHTIVARGWLRTEVPRHTEVIDELAGKICRDLDVPFVR